MIKQSGVILSGTFAVTDPENVFTVDMKIVILRDLKAKIFLIIRFCVNLKFKMAAMSFFCKSDSYQIRTNHGINNTRKKLMLLSRTSTFISNLVLSCPTTNVQVTDIELNEDI